MSCTNCLVQWEFRAAFDKSSLLLTTYFAEFCLFQIIEIAVLYINLHKCAIYLRSQIIIF